MMDQTRSSITGARAARPRRRDGAQAEHAARISFLDGARFAGRHRHDRARRRRASGERAASARSTASSSKDSATPICRRRCTTCSATTARRARRRSRRRSARRSGCTPRAVLRQMPEEPLQPVPMGAGLSRRRQRRRDRAADGRLSQGRLAHRHSDRRVPRRRHRRADLPRCGFSHRTRSGAPEHHAACPDSRRRRARSSGSCRRSSRTSPSRRARSPRSAST